MITLNSLAARFLFLATLCSTFASINQLHSEDLSVRPGSERRRIVRNGGQISSYGKPRIQTAYESPSPGSYVLGSQKTGWQWLNPLPQGNDLLAVVTLGRDTVIAVGASGTIVYGIGAEGSTDFVATLGLRYEQSEVPPGVPEDSLRLFRLDETTGLDQGESYSPKRYMLGQNFPNPFNPSTRIRFELAQDCQVSIRLYDMLGREVLVLLDDRRESGLHEVTLDSNGLASGVYFYRIEAGYFVQTRKSLLLR